MKINDLKKFRQEKNIPQSAIAESLGISRYQYSKMEQSEIVPDKYIPILSNILERDFSLVAPFNSLYLQALRNITGVSQKDLAAALGTWQQLVMKLEKGEHSFGYEKYKDSYFAFFKEKLANKEVLPFIVKEVPGAKILFCLDKCYILVGDEKLFDYPSLLIDPDVDITIYKLCSTE